MDVVIASLATTVAEVLVISVVFWDTKGAVPLDGDEPNEPATVKVSGP